MVSAGLGVVQPEVAAAADPVPVEPQRKTVEPEPLVSEPRDFDAEFGTATADPGLTERELAANAELGGTPSGIAVAPAISTNPRDVKRVAEVEHLTDEYSQTFITDDDQYVTEVSLDPQRFRSESGKWAPIDNTVVATRDGRGVLRNVGGIFDVRFHSAAQGVEIVVDGKKTESRGVVGNRV